MDRNRNLQTSKAPLNRQGQEQQLIHLCAESEGISKGYTVHGSHYIIPNIRVYSTQRKAQLYEILCLGHLIIEKIGGDESAQLLVHEGHLQIGKVE